MILHRFILFFVKKKSLQGGCIVMWFLRGCVMQLTHIIIRLITRRPLVLLLLLIVAVLLTFLFMSGYIQIPSSRPIPFNLM